MSEDLESKIQELEEVKSKLEESEEKYKAMVENANDVIFTMDLRGNLLSANKRSENLTGYTQKELLKMNVRQLLDRDSWKVVLKGIKEIIFTKTYDIDELQLRTKNGKIITIDARAALLKIGNKSYTIVGIVRDITERKKYEAVLQESEKKYRLVVENSNDVIFTADLKGNIKSVSKKVEKVIGYSQEELQKMHFSKLMSKSFLPSFMLGFKRLLTNGSDSMSDVPFIGKDGKKIYAEMHTSILRRSGKFHLIVGVIRDITERKKYEEDLKTAEEKFRTIFENTNDIIVYVDQTGKVIDISPNVEKLGYKREELIGRNFTALGVFSLKEIPNLAKIFKDMVFKGQTMDRMALNIKDKSGKSISVEVSTRSIKENDQIKGAVNIIRDVTERKKYEEELNVKVGALERYNKISVGREHTMMELKEKIRELEERLAER